MLLKLGLGIDGINNGDGGAVLSRLLLADGISFLLLADGTSNLGRP